ncbi:hypothetical protein LCGC14_2157730 [marine sediment metagenome]|uniref:NAD-dependent epimerase/dehydratase domain-containing protein n=1 Tax=marine sediment metagenome TaxID=412755 RepID=A0A0F9GPV6_9ZZZZ
MGSSVDVRNNQELHDAIVEADMVIHLAARKGSWFCDEDIEDTVDVNLLGTLRVAKLCTRLKVPMLHYGTTAYYYSGAEKILYDEEAELYPQTVYGVTKMNAELALREVPGLDYFVIRPVYGYGNIGYHAASRSESWPDVVMQEINNKRTEPLVTDLGGEYIKDYTHITDICSATWKLTELFYVGELPSGEIVQVGAGGNYTFQEFMEAFRAPFEIVYQPDLDYKKNQAHFYGRLRKYLPYWLPQIDALEYAHTRGSVGG